jgi:hypothetical protein
MMLTEEECFILRNASTSAEDAFVVSTAQWQKGYFPIEHELNGRNGGPDKGRAKSQTERGSVAFGDADIGNERQSNR